MHGSTCVNITVLLGWSDESIREIQPQMEFKSVTQIARDADKAHFVTTAHYVTMRAFRNKISAHFVTTRIS